MFLKKLATLAATILVVGTFVALTGCSSDDPSTDTANNTTVANETNKASSGEGDTNEASNNTGATSYTPGSAIHMTTSGKDIYINMPTSEFIDALGEPNTYFESESCAFQGLDKVYTYNDYVIRTYPKDDVDYVSSIELKSDSVTTSTGCFIGMDAETIKAQNASLTLDSETDTALVYVDGDCKLSYILTDGEASAITYTAVE